MDEAATALTALTIEKYKPSAKRRFVRDTKSQSLYLVIEKSGRKSFQMRFRRPDGKQVKITLGPYSSVAMEGEPQYGKPLTLAAARLLASEVNHRRAMGKDVIAEIKIKRIQPVVAVVLDPQAFLYRHFDAEGTLLYVGISLKPLARLSAHNRSHWFKQIATVTIQGFETNDEAVAAESAAIMNERPRYNIQVRLQPSASVKRPTLNTMYSAEEYPL